MATGSEVETPRIFDEYQSKEFPTKYHECLCSDRFKDEEDVMRVIQGFLQKEMKGQGRMLCFGCGPTIHRIASASRYYEEIICADPSVYNRNAVDKWLKGDEQCLDWTPLLKIVAEEEGCSDISSGIEEIERRIRSSVKNVIPCDLLEDPPIAEEYGNFDLVLTSFYMESVCTTEEMIKNSLRKICNLIKDGGHLILVHALALKSYTAHKDLENVSLRPGLITNTLLEYGMKLSFLVGISTKERHGVVYGIGTYGAVKE